MYAHVGLQFEWRVGMADVGRKLEGQALFIFFLLYLSAGKEGEGPLLAVVL